MSFCVTDLPFNRLLGITSGEEGGHHLGLPADACYTNHLGTVHAGALLALAEAASGDWLLREFADIGFDTVPVVRRLDAKFRKPAQGAIRSCVRPPETSREEFVQAIADKGRATVELVVDVFDEQGHHALTASVEWFVARK